MQEPLLVLLMLLSLAVCTALLTLHGHGLARLSFAETPGTIGLLAATLGDLCGQLALLLQPHITRCGPAEMAAPSALLWGLPAFVGIPGLVFFLSVDTAAMSLWPTVVSV